MSSERLHLRGRVASLSRSRTPDDPELVDARRSLKFAGLEEYAREIAQQFPPLTPAQVDRIAALLRAGGDRIA